MFLQFKQCYHFNIISLFLTTMDIEIESDVLGLDEEFKPKKMRFTCLGDNDRLEYLDFPIHILTKYTEYLYEVIESSEDAEIIEYPSNKVFNLNHLKWALSIIEHNFRSGTDTDFTKQIEFINRDMYNGLSEHFNEKQKTLLYEKAIHFINGNTELDQLCSDAELRRLIGKFNEELNHKQHEENMCKARADDRDEEEVKHDMLDIYTYDDFILHHSYVQENNLGLPDFPTCVFIAHIYEYLQISDGVLVTYIMNRLMHAKIPLEIPDLTEEEEKIYAEIEKVLSGEIEVKGDGKEDNKEQPHERVKRFLQRMYDSCCTLPKNTGHHHPNESSKMEYE